MKRDVYIKEVSRSGKIVAYMVCYCKRRKGQRYMAAQFDGTVGIEHVISWISNNPKLRMVA